MKSRLLPYLEEDQDGFWKTMYEERQINGYKCAVVTMSTGRVNGYVEVRKDHPSMTNVTENGTYNVDLPCHGGITYVEHSPVTTDHWVIGFDTNHCKDLCPTHSGPELVKYQTYKGPNFVWQELKDLTKALVDEE